MSTQSRTSPRSFWLTTIALFVVEVLLFSLHLVWFPGPNRYQAKEWTLSYGHALVRRGLLGETLRFLHLDNGNFLLITLLSWVVAFALFAVIARLVYRLLEREGSPTGTTLALVALLSPAISGALINVVADPVQVALLLFFGLVLLTKNEKPVRDFICFAVIGVVATLIHEASVFFIAPFFVARLFLARSGKAAFAGYLLAALPLLIVVTHAAQHDVHAAVAPMHYFGKSLDSPDTWEVTASYSQLLQHENVVHFHGGLHGYVLMVRNALGGLWLPALFVTVIAFAYRSRIVKTAAIMLAFNLPLWVIAHDYGRFSSYLFFELLIALALYDKVEQRREVSVPVLVLLGLTAGVSDSRLLGWYEIKGIGADTYTSLAVMALSGLVLWNLFRDEIPEAASQPAGQLATELVNVE